MSIELTDPAVDDLRRAGPVVAALGPRSDPHARGGDPTRVRRWSIARTGFRVLDALDGDARVVFGVDGTGTGAGTGTGTGTGTVVTVHEIWVDGARSDGEAYAEALERVRAADPSEQVALARSVQRLARLTGVRPVPSDRLRAPVPDWLADALVATPA